MSEQQQVPEQQAETAPREGPGEQPGPGWARACGGVWQSAEDWQRFLEQELFRWSWHLATESETQRARVEEQLRSLRPDAMTNAAHEAHLRLALELFDAGIVPTYTTVSEAAKRDPRLLKRLGDWEVIGECWFPGPANHPYPDMPEDEKCGILISQIVSWLNRHAEQRAKVATLVKAQAEVLRGGDPTELLDQLLADEPDDRVEDGTFADLMRSTMMHTLEVADARKRVRLTTGFALLDDTMGPLDVGSMTVIGGRPGDGKSSLALAMQERWAQRGIVSALISCEDPEDIVGRRVTAMVCNVSQDIFRGTGAVPTRQQGERFEYELRKPERERARASFQIGRTLNDVLRAVTRMVRRHKAQVVVVDYVQTIKGDHSVDRRHEIRRIAAALKGLCARLGVPLVLLSQLKRYEGKRPKMRDLRDAGELEEIAENILLMWREDRMEKLADGTGRRVEERFAVLDKAKGGPPGAVFKVSWNGTSASVHDLVSAAEADADDYRDDEPRQSSLYSRLRGGPR